MKNIIFLSVSLALYIVTIVLLALKLRHIIKKPDLYGNEQLIEQAEKFLAEKTEDSFAQDDDAQEGNKDKITKRYTLYCMLMFVVPMCGIGYLLVWLIQKIMIGNNPSIFLGTSLGGLTAMLLLNIIIGIAVIPLTIKKPMFELASRESVSYTIYIKNLHKRQTKGENVSASFVSFRQFRYKRIYIAFLAFFILLYPFIALSANNYCYYNEQYIAYSQYFELGEHVVRYEDIDKVEVAIFHNKKDNIETFEYVIYFDDTSMNINDPNVGARYLSEQVYDIHQFIEKQGGCTIEIQPLTDKDKEYISQHMSERQQQIINYIYEGFHSNK